MAKKDKKVSREVLLLGTGVGLLVFLAIVIGLTFTFLVNNVLPAITPGGDEVSVEEVKFDLEGFEELGL